MRHMMTKTKRYPLPHNFRQKILFDINHNNRYCTILPIAVSKPQRDPKLINSNPEHPNFIEYSSALCYGGASIDHMFTKLDFNLTKHSIQIDKVEAIKVGFMPIFTSFKEDLVAEDDRTGETIASILHLSKSDGTQSTFPQSQTTFVGQPSTNTGAGYGSFPCYAQPFDIDDYYDQLHYGQISKKLQACQGGLNWFTMTKQHPTRTVMIKQRSKTKYMNKYTFFGVMVIVPAAHLWWQIPNPGDVTSPAFGTLINSGHVQLRATTRFDEWHDEFDASRFG